MATEYVAHQDLNALRAELRGEVRGEIGSHVRTIVYANVGLAIGVGGLVLAATQLA